MESANGNGGGGGERIAVVAVHGIGQQKPGDSVRAIAGLLLRLRHADGSSRFSSFREVPLQVPVRKVGISPPGDSTSAQPAPHPAPGGHDPGRVEFTRDYDFMRQRLEAYEGSEEPYITTRVEGLRGTASNPQAARIHLYEVYWEDLSRLGEGSLKLLGTIYQLLFDAANLGKVAVDQASPQFKHVRGWSAYGTVHAFTVSLFTIMVPLTWLLMLGTSLTLLLVELPEQVKRLTIALLAGVATFGALWFLIDRARAKVPPRLSLRWSWPAAIIPIIVSYVVTPAIADWSPTTVDVGIVYVWTAVMCVLVWLIFARYDRVRPGVKRIGRLGAVVVFVGTVVWVWPSRFPDEVLSRVLEVFVAETGVTVFGWYVMYVCGSVAALIGLWSRSKVKERSERRRLRRTHWTAAATLGIATSLVLVMTYVLWSGILATSGPLLRDLGLEWFRVRLPWMHDLAAPPDNMNRLVYYLEQLLQGSAGAGYAIMLLGLLAALMTAAIILFPSLREELSPRPGAGPEAAARMGRDLTAGLRVAATTAVWLFIIAYGFHPLFSLAHWLHEFTGQLAAIDGPLEWLHTRGATWITWSGGLLGASGIGLLALRGRVGPLVDTALDVDNYMREEPRRHTPRARIVERYASVLRYLNAWRDDHGHPYDRVVIIAHSQGTAITVDLLGFLRREADANRDLWPLVAGPTDRADHRHLSLFTMGSPLRQIYARAFPMLFEWMNAAAHGWGESQRHPPLRVEGETPAAGLADDAAPHPHHFGLWRWVNAYRSGDYVGREIWRDAREHGEHLYAPGDIAEDAAGSRRELCIGSGAHTRYWDATAGAIGEELDRLIATPARA